VRDAVLREYGVPSPGEFEEPAAAAGQAVVEVLAAGHTNFAAPPEVKREAYGKLSEAAARGEIVVDVDRIPLAQVGEAWERLGAGSHRKLVLVP
jgi:hypothetical protein